MFGKRKKKQMAMGEPKKKKKKWLTRHFREVIALYDELYYAFKVKNESFFSAQYLQEPNKVAVDFVGMHDGDNITYFYLIQGLPKELEMQFKHRMRSECQGGVRVNFFTYMRGHTIDWSSPQMSSRLRVLKEVSEENSQQDVNVYNLHKNIGAMSRQDWVEESLQYLSIADIKRQRALLRFSMLVAVSGKRGDDFDESVKGVEQYAKHVGIQLTRVLYDIPHVLRYFSPFHRDFSRKPEKSIYSSIATDEILSRFNTYGQGRLGMRGVNFGVDVRTKQPVLKVVKSQSTDAEIWLLVGETGSGKSMCAKDKIIQLQGLGYNITIMDIEGYEYIYYANFLANNSKVTIVNMGEGQGKYVDPLPIFDVDGMDRAEGVIEVDPYAFSQSFTISTFRTILGKAYEEDIWLDTVVNDAVTETYRRAGVTKEEETWHLSVDLRLHSVYQVLNDLYKERYRSEQPYLEALSKAIAISSKYFEPNGTRSNVFQENIELGDVIDSDLVVCSFGMAMKSTYSVDPTQMALMQLWAAQISYQRSIYSFIQGKFNAKIWEEFQRWGDFPGADKTIGVAITGGRKLGDVNVVITNDVKKILDDDRFGIFSNITSFLIGAIADHKVRVELAERMSIPHMVEDLHSIAKANKEVETEDVPRNPSEPQKKKTESVQVHPLRYAFLCGLDRSKYAVVQTKLPKKLAETNLFKTGVGEG